MPEYGIALSYTTKTEKPEESWVEFVKGTLKHNFDMTKAAHPEWDLPEWDKVEIKHAMATQVREVLPCEHGTDDGDPLFDRCEVEDCYGYISGDVIPDKWQQAMGWYVNTD